MNIVSEGRCWRGEVGERVLKATMLSRLRDSLDCSPAAEQNPQTDGEFRPG